MCAFSVVKLQVSQDQQKASFSDEKNRQIEDETTIENVEGEVPVNEDPLNPPNLMHVMQVQHRARNGAT